MLRQKISDRHLCKQALTLAELKQQLRRAVNAATQPEGRRASHPRRTTADRKGSTVIPYGIYT